MSWDRIETMGRSLDLDDGVAARISDPYWMLGRQWQVGEFRGDNAGQPASVSIEIEAYPIQSFRPGLQSRSSDIFDRSNRSLTQPLEAMVERSAAPRSGLARVHHTVQLAERLVEAIEAIGGTDVREQLREVRGATLTVPEAQMSPRTDAATRMLVRRGLDGESLLRSRDAVVDVVQKLDGVDPDAGKAAVLDWEAAVTATGDTEAWQAERLEYRASVAAMTSDGEVVLDLPEHHGGHLDWYQFDLGGESHGLVDDDIVKDLIDQPRRVAIPTPATFAGQPASRWWEFEDRRVHLGDIQSGPTDFARLAVAEFAMSYSDDWFVVPLRLPTGSLSRVTRLRVVDTFGGELPESIEHIAVNDASTRKRAFRLFELDGSRDTPPAQAPWHFLAPALATSMIGEAVERVVFARDEGANLAWAVEQYVEGPLGRPLDRGREWFAGTGAEAEATPDGGTTADDNSQESWPYRLHAGVTPAWWVPLVPERTEGSEQIRLRRGRMRQWEELHSSAGPAGELLEPDRPFFVEESEVPKSGTQVDRRWEYARWVDGSAHLWQQRGKGPVRSLPSSGLRWDHLGPAD